ncbi:2-oxo-hept-4-ene-1,7-dioate hydratase [Mesorhizobium australicum]|uniref:2-oxo-hept-3-ene-1,7-dioate hydratase n=1 Tax=Mesorhizobium australicum TaxID=536018 RepID=A0A1X7PSJ4_9HYPH|nr:2-oxo-hepta-3-ene-1,7-dioic acid hydratase [Mesorhizobium australicum]SMH54203.1 2-oxo-hept-3-ene-1,7-dioate hydratase [Mesorhizobium australicum]
MMSPEAVAAAANALDQAERTRVQIGLLSLQHPGMDMADAYAVQSAWVQRKLGDGRRIVGRKIGLTSKAMQSALNIDIPDSGVLFHDMLFKNGGTVPKGRFIQPRIEAELAFVMKAPLAGPGVTPQDVIRATDYVQPALEILDTRILRVDPETRKTRTVFDTIADNAANAGIVLGGERRRPDDIDLRWAGAIVYRDGEVEETGLGAGVLDDPALSMAWLANRLATYGDRIEAGEIVLSGSFVRPIEAPSGCFIRADYGPLGQLTLSFE